MFSVRALSSSSLFFLTATLILAEQPAAPLPPGEAGIVWYSRWDSALEEARRSNRPILFQSASAQCNGVPGVF